ncbi:hypothetical protein BJX61DRAFT_396000 [Aspergillus egyptiacus]|nr:hypothetical protein BJX61DRAFT_396000 [Aspergillus egyptiacus]
METESNSASTGKTRNKPRVMQGSQSSMTYSDSNAQHISWRNPRTCNCVKENDDKPNQDYANDMTRISKSTVVRPKPLNLSPDRSSLSSPPGRLARRASSSPECAAQRSPLQPHSPASFIFERNVQEDILLPQTSPAIPSHIRTENHIPPVLEASSAAIADNGLDPDSVEIVTHSMHHPAASCVFSTEQSSQSLYPEIGAMDTGDTEDVPSTSQSPDANGIRRLSFISFADVVNAENAETSEHPPSHDLPKGATNPPTTVCRNTSPSPLYSPASSHGFGTSPPTSISASLKGLEPSPNRGAHGADSPLPVQRPCSPSLGGELNIETMSQALRRTGSGDLSASRNQFSSTGSSDDRTV